MVTEKGVSSMSSMRRRTIVVSHTICRLNIAAHPWWHVNPSWDGPKMSNRNHFDFDVYLIFRVLPFL